MEQINVNKMASMLETTDNVYKHLSDEDLKEEYELMNSLLIRARNENNTNAIEWINDELEMINEVYKKCGNKKT